eukprot:806155-Prymnesium_polylepis.1
MPERKIQRRDPGQSMLAVYAGLGEGLEHTPAEALRRLACESSDRGTSDRRRSTHDCGSSFPRQRERPAGDW